MITFDDVAPPQQPISVNENPTKVKTDTSAILGNMSRMQAPSKNRSVMQYTATPETFQFFKALYDAAAAVTYKNTDSNVSGSTLEFECIIDFDEDAYIRGGSNLVPLTVTVYEADITGL
jgi:hypothetical protein